MVRTVIEQLVSWDISEHSTHWTTLYIYIYVCVCVSKVGDRSQGRLEGSLFSSYYSEVYWRALFHFTLDFFLIMLSVKQGGIKYHFWVFRMTRPGKIPLVSWDIGENSTHWTTLYIYIYIYISLKTKKNSRYTPFYI